MLVKKFYIKDIKDYEERSRKSVIDILAKFDFEGLLGLISIGNGSRLNEDEAGAILDRYLFNHTVVDAFREVREALFGSEPKESEKSVDITDYQSLTDVYSKMCFELMSVGISYSEFWEFSTLDMYRAFDACMIKVENDTNDKLSMAYNSAALIASAVWGKLPKDVPHVSLVNRGENIIHTEEYGDLTEDEFRDLCKMKALVAVTGGE